MAVSWIQVHLFLDSVRAESLYHDHLNESHYFILPSFLLVDTMLTKEANWNRFPYPSIKIFSILATFVFVVIVVIFCMWHRRVYIVS